MKKLFYLIGYPASGKTTLAKALKETGNYDYVSTDDVFDNLYKEGLKYSEILAKRHITMVSRILSQGQKCPNIILDTYTPYREERAEILRFIPPTYEKIAVIMDTDKKECISRFIKRGKLRKSCLPGFAHETIEPPTLDEFHRIIRSSDIAPQNLQVNSTTTNIGPQKSFLLPTGLFTKLILKHILKYYDETFSHGPLVKVSFRIHHIRFPQMWFDYLGKHLDDLSRSISDIINQECTVTWFEFTKGKFLVAVIESEKNK